MLGPLHRVFLAISLFLALAGQAGCQPASPVVRSLGVPVLHTPTSVVLAYRTPIPTQTVTPSPVVYTTTPDFDPEFFFGSMLVTMDDVGKIIKIRRGEAFVLTLVDGYHWTVTVDPADMITLNRKITPQPGDQGVFIARKRGQAVLRAVGEPVCRAYAPPCARPDLLFQAIIKVD